MSYDLYFKNDIQPITEEQFAKFFSGRKNYSLDGSSALYENECTGVHFVFEFGDNGEYEPEMQSLNISFNLNFCRPMFFVREAEPEVKALVECFSLLVADPQAGDLDAKNYDAEAFISHWTKVNAGSYNIILENDAVASSLPSKVLDEAWEWNFKRDELQDSVPDDIFVPLIRMAKYKGKVVTFAVWTDAIPTLIPVVDVLLNCRAALAPRKFLVKSPDMAVGLWADFQPLLDKYKLKMLNGAYYLFYPQAPSDLVKAIRVLRPSRKEFSGLPSYEVLDREIIERQQDLIKDGNPPQFTSHPPLQ